jgi:hypothetical protein
VDVQGGRAGLDWSLGHVGLRGSVGTRTSSVDTGGTVYGLGLRTLVRPNLGLALNLDSDFAFFTPQAVRSDVRMTSLGFDLSNPLTSRLGVNAGYARAHFEGPDVDQNRDLLSAGLRYQAGGFGGDFGNVRIDLGARGRYFRFDRQYPDVGYWNPRDFRQVMGLLGGTYRKGEEFTLIANASLGAQREATRDWEMAAYLYAEALKQMGRRTDLWLRADYSNSGFARRPDAGGGYRAWTVAAGILVRLGDRTPEPRPAVPAPTEPGPLPPFPPPTP